MPYRGGPGRSRIAVMVGAKCPSLIYKAAEKTGKVSGQAYLQKVIAEALARDLDLPVGPILDAMPPNRGTGSRLRAHRHVGPTNTIEEVK